MDQQLSLVAQYDELVRNRKVLTAGIEIEFWKFALNQEVCRKRWMECNQHQQETRVKVKTLESENNSLQTKLKHARTQIEHELRKRQHAEQERDNLEGQILMVRELLAGKNTTHLIDDKDREKLAFLSTDFQASHYRSPRKSLNAIEESASLLSPSDFSYDKTEEDIDTPKLRSGKKYRKKKRPSAPPMEEGEDGDTPPEKRNRRDDQQRRLRRHRRSRSAVVATTTITADETAVDVKQEIAGVDGRSKRQQLHQQRGRSSSPTRSMKKYYSDTKAAKDAALLGEANILQPGRSPLGNESPTGLRHYNSGSTSLNRPHVLQQKTVIKPETCTPCGKKIRFGKAVMKCKDCRVCTHPECKEQLPLPCVPVMTTPGAPGKITTWGYLADFAPSDPPMIPALVIHCVNEIEARGLNEVGIYRVPGTESEVKELKEKFFRGKGVPNLNHVNDIHVICGCLKDFLRGLKEPLVTIRLWKDFVDAAENPDRDVGVASIFQAVSQLPQPNRDTIAFIILHLQRVGECEDCKMPLANLAKVFGPTLVGYSSPAVEPIQMITETGKQQKVMERLLEIPSDYWINFINVDSADPNYTQRNNPMITLQDDSPVVHSILGPLSATPGKYDDRRWLTPSFRLGTTNYGGISSVKKSTSQFFASPVLH